MTIDYTYFSDTEPDKDDNFQSVEYNLAPAENSISRRYFEENFKSRAVSEERTRPRRVHRLKLEKNYIKDMCSSYNAPATSPNNSIKFRDSFVKVQRKLLDDEDGVKIPRKPTKANTEKLTPATKFNFLDNLIQVQFPEVVTSLKRNLNLS